MVLILAVLVETTDFFVFQVSVPLRGLWFLSKEHTMKQQMTKSFPSPYGDYGSYRDNKFYMFIFYACFRPLTGIMVLIRTPYKWLHRAIKNAFCGADFLFSSFFTFLWKMIFKNRPIADF